MTESFIDFCSVQAEEAEKAGSGKVGGAKALPRSQTKSEELEEEEPRVGRLCGPLRKRQDHRRRQL